MTADQTDAPVIVGVDGSPAALRAVRLAAAEAHRRARPLRLVHAFVWPLMHVPVTPPPGGPPGSGLRHQAERLLADAVAEAHATRPDVPVEATIINGQASAVLCREALHATLVVLGDRGLGGFTSLLIGSVAIQVSSHAPCPVMVARGDEHPTGPVVVGVDGSTLSQRAVDFAVEEAALLGTGLTALHAWRHPNNGDTGPTAHDPDTLRADAQQTLTESVTPLADRYPDVPVITRLVTQRPAPALIDASRQAQLVVVGALGRGGFTGLVLGSVSQAILHHSHCPVVIVRQANGHAHRG